jgi:hypothetical protein
LFRSPFEFFQERGPQKVGDANKLIPRCALNLEEHGVRYAGLDRSAVGSRKYFTALALFEGGWSAVLGAQPFDYPLAAFERGSFIFWTTLLCFGQRTLGMLWAAIVCA